MKRSLTAALILIALGCRGKSRETSTSVPGATTQTTTAATSPAPYDLQFLDTMSKHHRAAIEMASMARGKLRLLELKALATRIPLDQRKEIDQMQAWRDQWYLGAPPAENMDMPGMKSSMNMDMSQLQAAQPGPAYDAMFIDMMIQHHEGAVEMSKGATRAEHEELRILARQIISAQTREIAQMRQWKTQLRRQ